jgi:5-formyltetrahydrofolate cyclo-ligase
MARAKAIATWSSPSCASSHPPVPVATIVHDLQIVDSVPRDPTDQPLSVIATPTHAIRIKRPDGSRLDAPHPRGP